MTNTPDRTTTNGVVEHQPLDVHWPDEIRALTEDEYAAWKAGTSADPVFIPPPWAPDCLGECLSRERAGRDPEVDHDPVMCVSCGGWVCVSCERRPVASFLTRCEACETQ